MKAVGFSSKFVKHYLLREMTLSKIKKSSIVQIKIKLLLLYYYILLLLAY